MNLAGIFNSDAFTMETLTASINEQPYIPGRISKLGLFSESGMATTTALIERKGTLLTIAPTLPRGAPGTPMVPDKRQAVTLTAPHVPVSDEIVADEIQGVREFGSADQLRTVTTVRDMKLLKMAQTLDLTLEYHRLGAIQGLVLDSNGSTLLNLFTTFGIEAPAANALGLAEVWAEADGGVIRGKLTAVKRLTRNALAGDAPVEQDNQPIGSVDPSGYWCPCGDEFFDTLTNHPELRSTYLNQMEANALRNGDPLDAFNYGGITFENYRGTGAVAIASNTGILVPIGIPNLFITRFAPAPWFSAVNTLGLPRYSMATLDPTGEKRIDLEGQMNDLNVCTRPEAIQTLTL